MTHYYTDPRQSATKLDLRMRVNNRADIVDGFNHYCARTGQQGEAAQHNWCVEVFEPFIQSWAQRLTTCSASVQYGVFSDLYMAMKRAYPDDADNALDFVMDNLAGTTNVGPATIQKLKTYVAEVSPQRLRAHYGRASAMAGQAL